jgi:arylsulfatase A-like enzyme
MARHTQRRALAHSRRAFLQAAAATGAAVIAPQLLPVPRAGAATRARPNLVFFLGEGARWDESWLAGNRLLKTPNIDRIGREGAVFSNAFCINSLCLPARATILSGLYSHTTGAVDNQHSKVPDRFPVVTDLIRSHGYEVAFIGKSHVQGSLMDRYWDYYFGFSGQADYQCPVIVEGTHGRFGAPQSYHEYVDDLLTRKAVDWLGRSIARRSVCFCGFTRRMRRSIDP